MVRPNPIYCFYGPPDTKNLKNEITNFNTFYIEFFKVNNHTIGFISK